MGEPDRTAKASLTAEQEAASAAGAGSNREPRDGLRMTREEMLELALKTVEHLVERVDGVGNAQAWDGDFQRALEDKLLEAPPEDGHPAAEVIDRAIRDILLFRCAWTIPDFSA